MNRKVISQKERFIKIFTSAICEMADVLFDPQEIYSEIPLSVPKKRLRSISIPEMIQPTEIEMQKAKQLAERMGLHSFRRR